MTSQKLIVIIGITGNQGSSVANAFLQDPSWKIRGLSRNIESQASRDLIKQGVEMVKADLDNVQSLIDAFKGANLIFSVTDFWQFFFDPVHQANAAERAISIGQYAYDRELQHGRNIVDAAASPEIFNGLDEQVGFIASTLSSARTCSAGKMQELWHFDSKADVFPAYVDEKYADHLARKMSFVQTGVFMSSWRYSPDMFMGWNGQSRMHEMKFSANPDAIMPHLDVRADTGHFVKALLQLPTGSTVMAAGTWCSWSDYMRTWEKVTGRRATYKQITTAEMDAMIPGGFGKEIGDMWEYSCDPGYDGGDKNILRLDDLQKVDMLSSWGFGQYVADSVSQAGITIPVTSLEDYMRREDYSMAWAGLTSDRAGRHSLEDI